MYRFFKAIFMIEPMEMKNFILFLFLGICTGVFLVSTDVTIVAYFLREHDSEQLIQSLLYSSILSFVILRIFTYFQNWISYSKIASLSLICLSGIMLYLYLGNVGMGSASGSEEAMLFLFPANMLGLRIFWGAFERIFDIEQIQRLSSKIDFGFYSGAIATAFILKETTQDVASINYGFAISFISSLGMLVFLLKLAFSNPSIYQITENAQYILDKNSFIKIFKKKYIIFLALFSLISGLTFLFLEFSFFEVVDDSKRDPLEMYGYLLSTLGITYTFALPLNFFLSHYFIEKYGLKTVLVSSTAILGLFTLLLVVADSYYGYEIYYGEDMDRKYPFLLIVMLCTICKILYLLLHRTIEMPAFKMYFLPIDYRLRQNTMVKIIGQIRTLGILAGTLVVNFLITEDTDAFIHTTYILMGLLIAWIIVTSVLHKEYRITLTNALGKDKDETKLELTGSDVELEIVAQIKKENKREIPSLLYLLRVLNPLIYRSVIARLLNSTNERVQKIALNEAKSLSLIEVLPMIASFKESKYFQASNNKDLFLDTEAKLEAAKGRLDRAKYLEQLTLSKLTSERAFGATLISYAPDEVKPGLLRRLMVDPYKKPQYNAIISSANIAEKDLNKMVIEKLGDEYFSNAALSSLAATNKDIYHTLEGAFYMTGQTQKIQSRIVQVYGRHKTPKAAEALLDKMNNSNQLVSTAAIRELSNIGTTVEGKKALQIRSTLEEECHSLIWKMALYLDLYKQESSSILIDAVESEINHNYDKIYQLLSLLYDAKSIKIVRDNIYSDDINDAEFAAELLEVIVSEELKSLVIPLLSSSSYENKVRKGQEHFPTEPQAEKEILIDLIQADYKNINRWTKACALMRLADLADEEEHKIFIANLVNPDQMLRETAARALFKLDKKGIYKHLNRYKNSDKTVTTNDIITPENLFYDSSQGSAPTLKFELINFFKKIPEFEKISGIILLEIAKLAELMTFEKGKQVASYEQLSDLDFYIVFNGEVELSIKTKFEQTYNFNNGQLFGPLDFIENLNKKVEITAKEDCSIYRIRAISFNELMSFYEEIPFSIMDFTKNSPEKILVTQ